MSGDPFEALMDGLAAKLGADYAAEVAHVELHKEDLIDPTGTPLTPSWHGRDCLGNGHWPGYECCCDNCDFYLNCFPEANDPELKYHYGDQRDFWRPDVREETCMDCKHHGKHLQNSRKLFCHITKRYGRELRGRRCPHFESNDAE